MCLQPHQKVKVMVQGRTELYILITKEINGRVADGMSVGYGAVTLCSSWGRGQCLMKPLNLWGLLSQVCCHTEKWFCYIFTDFESDWVLVLLVCHSRMSPSNLQCFTYNSLSSTRHCTELCIIQNVIQGSCFFSSSFLGSLGFVYVKPKRYLIETS